MELPSFLNPGSLSSRDIRRCIEVGYLGVKSPAELDIQAASIDVSVARTIAQFSRNKFDEGCIDLKKPVDNLMEFIVMDPVKGFMLHPREFILGVTREWFDIPSRLEGKLDGKSSLGRLGVVVHVTAGYFDPGFAGHGTLEITNLTERPVRIYPNIPIGQMRFSTLTSEPENVYGDKALGSKSYKNPYTEDPKPIPSEYWKNWHNGKIK